MLSKNKLLSISLIAGLVVICVVILVEKASLDRHSAAGHLLRRLHGEKGVNQTVNDLADELRQTSFMNELQNWSVETMSKFNSGAEVGDRNVTQNLPFKSIVVPPRAIPQFIQNKWQEQPEIVILISTNGHAESILMDWYSHGLVIGPTNYYQTDLPWKPYYVVPVQPGVFAVWVNSK